MKLILRAFVLPAIVLGLGVAGSHVAVSAQAPVPSAAAAAAPAPPPPIPLKVQVTISRYVSDKRTSNLPFTLWVNAGDNRQSTLTTGQQLPISTGEGRYTYQNVGTTITLLANRLADGRFSVRLSVSDSSVIPIKEGMPITLGPPNNLVLKSMSTTNELLLRDGQTVEFVAAADQVNSEVTKIEATLTVLK